MSDIYATDLRTRIAAVLAETDGMPWNMWSEPSQDGYLLRADAVIAELQLTQQYLVDGIISDGEPRPWEVPCETRYETEWEPFRGRRWEPLRTRIADRHSTTVSPMSNRWRVCKRDGIWRVYDRNDWHESWPTLSEAHTAAMQLAITAEIFKPGGVTAVRACVDWAAEHLVDKVDKALRSLGLLR